ncbi:hypothetical protein A3F06_02395 [candidate division TM6 bacterium RIFCSPHIGHO2_12_FULL_36_22]|nr:MAG: hypothetical protein A3F06_02395 [candidate division TM6 bacterium RIFCSPHIGHO2_12_FULL_36_22]
MNYRFTILALLLFLGSTPCIQGMTSKFWGGSSDTESGSESEEESTEMEIETQSDEPFVLQSEAELQMLGHPREKTPETLETILQQTSPLKKTLAGVPLTPERATNILIRTRKISEENSPLKRGSAIAQRVAGAIVRGHMDQELLTEITEHGQMPQVRSLLFSPKGRRFVRKLRLMRPERKVLSMAAKMAPESPHILRNLPDIEHAGLDGGHILTQKQYTQRVVTPTRQLGEQVYVNPETGVWTGLYQGNQSPSPEPKTGFPVGINPDEIIKAHQTPHKKIASDDHRSLEEWILPGNISVIIERIADPDKVVDRTFYPIWYFNQYSDTNPQNIPGIGLVTPQDTLTYATNLLKKHQFGEESPIRYESEVDTSPETVTIDIGPALGNKVLDKGIYVEFPRNLFSDYDLIMAH